VCGAAFHSTWSEHRNCPVGTLVGATRAYGPVGIAPFHFNGPFFITPAQYTIATVGTSSLRSLAVVCRATGGGAPPRLPPSPGTPHPALPFPATRGEQPTRRPLSPDPRRAVNEVLSRHTRSAVAFCLISDLLCVVSVSA
jgi:hypothetical protein